MGPAYYTNRSHNVDSHKVTSSAALISANHSYLKAKLSFFGEQSGAGRIEQRQEGHDAQADCAGSVPHFIKTATRIAKRM